tara:strand:- start:8744 stop:9658 length:915 start_codon:yes stop_codon:yes gene_type:complete
VLSLFAPAKINLYLHVGPPRADGRHPLDSLVVFADERVADIIRYVPGPEPLCLIVSGPRAGEAELGDPQDNLVMQAAEAVIRNTERDVTGRLELEKHLPIAAGIGGGSADAAATLRVLNRALDLRLSEGELMDIARPLGGDVPACLAGKPVLMRGDGDRIEPVTPAPPVLNAVIVNSGRPCPTGAVFQAFDQLSGEKSFSECSPPSASVVEDWISELSENYRNDLQEAARKLVPEVDLTLWRLSRCEGVRHVAMSGSGATCFGLFLSAEESEQAAKAISQDFPNWFARPTLFGLAGFDLRPRHA